MAAVAARHDGLVAWPALLRSGLSEAEAHDATRRLRRLHDGVWVTGHGRITDHQRWLAATLTAPRTVLSHASAARCWGARDRRGGFEVVTRPGRGGPRRIGDLLICRSSCLQGWVTTRDGIPITTAARTAIDLAPLLDEQAVRKLVREAIRLGVLTALELRLAVAAHHGRRGTALLRDVAVALDDLPIARTRSDAEARSLEVIKAAQRPVPRSNVWIGGEEADLVWPAARGIIEIDGPQFHRDAAEDARKQAVWEAAGWRVERLPSDDPFDRPERLIALVDRVSVHGLG